MGIDNGVPIDFYYSRAFSGSICVTRRLCGMHGLLQNPEIGLQAINSTGYPPIKKGVGLADRELNEQIDQSDSHEE